MDREALAGIFRDLDSRLSASVDLVLVGGAAMILHFGAQRATRDVDVILLRGDQERLREAVRAIAQDHKLPVDWLTDAAKGFADVLPPDFQQRLTLLSLGLVRLRLYALASPDQVIMKAVALREQDMEDLELLLPVLSDEDKRIVISAVERLERVRPDWAQKVRYFLLERGWQIP